MKILFILSILFGMSIGIFSVTGDTIEQDMLTSLEKETFEYLKRKFPGEILDKNLKTLHELAETPEYKNFLAKSYPSASLPPEFVYALHADGPLIDNILYKIRPPKAQYRTYYIDHFGIQRVDEVTDIEHFIVHARVTSHWISGAIKRGGDTPTYQRTGDFRLSARTWPRILCTLQLRKMLDIRFGIKAYQDLSKVPPVVTQGVIRYIEMPVMKLTDLRLAADSRWIKGLFEKHGKANGCLWLAIQAPALLSRIRYAFTTDTTFLRFVYTDPDEAEAAERAAYEKRSKERYQNKK